MIKSIDGLKIPASVDSVSELTNRDSVSQTVSGRLVANLDPNPKWKCSVAFNEFSLALSFQTQFYAKCLTMRTQPKQLVIVSPYDNSEKTITALCTDMTTPEIAAISKKSQKPFFYQKCGAEFREV